MENRLLSKLKIKPEFSLFLWNAPNNVDQIFGYIPAFSLNSAESKPEVMLAFCTTEQELNQFLLEHSSLVNDHTLIWIIYPKASSKLAGDLNLMKSSASLDKFNLGPCASAAVDANWTAIRLKPSLLIKKSGVGNKEIAAGEYSEFIDIKNRKVSLPDQLNTEFAAAGVAQLFTTLAYSHQKEYLIWILSAKQQKTKAERISKTIDKLKAGKKNPSQK